MNKIKSFRRNLGMTVRELAEKANVAVGYTSMLENHTNLNPTKEVMERIALALGQTVPEIFYPNKGGNPYESIYKRSK